MKNIIQLWAPHVYGKTKAEQYSFYLTVRVTVFLALNLQRNFHSGIRHMCKINNHERSGTSISVLNSSGEMDRQQRTSEFLTRE